eukprot:6177397-Alexandrium_andersonii.AAC.1
MSASLVGSEMCIRDSALRTRIPTGTLWHTVSAQVMMAIHKQTGAMNIICLLYTSDAADDM